MSHQKRKDHRTKIFNQGAKALNTLGIAGNYYACPICLVLCDEDQLDAGNLTEEHVPQRSQGGKAIILTCRACNNQAGHSYERALKDRDNFYQQLSNLDAENAFVGRAKLKVGEAALNVILQKVAGSVDVAVPSFNNNPRAIDSFHEAMKNSDVGQDISITLGSKYDPSKARLSDLKNAYLACVANFGYSYAASEHIVFIRRQLMQGKEFMYSTRYFNAPNIPDGSIFSDLSKEVLLVKFKRRAILMPFPTLAFDDFLKVAYSDKPINFQGGYQLVPNSFIAQIDHQGRHSVSTTTQPQV